MYHNAEVKGNKQKIKELTEELATTKQDNDKINAKLLITEMHANRMENNLKKVNMAILRNKGLKCGCLSRASELVKEAEITNARLPLHDKKTNQVAEIHRQLK